MAESFCLFAVCTNFVPDGKLVLSPFQDYSKKEILDLLGNYIFY